MAPPGLRVIAGSVRGRRLAAPAGDDIRPTKGIVREAMFSALSSRGAIADAVVLDLYAGTGALGLEALSRGADRAVLVERDRRALEAIEANVEHTGFVDRARVVRSDVEDFLDAPPPPEAPFDLVFADPPYDDASAVAHSLADALPALVDENARIVTESDKRNPLVLPLPLLVERNYGDTRIAIHSAT